MIVTEDAELRIVPTKGFFSPSFVSECWKLIIIWLVALRFKRKNIWERKKTELHFKNQNYVKPNQKRWNQKWLKLEVAEPDVKNRNGEKTVLHFKKNKMYFKPKQKWWKTEVVTTGSGQIRSSQTGSGKNRKWWKNKNYYIWKKLNDAKLNRKWPNEKWWKPEMGGAELHFTKQNYIIIIVLVCIISIVI